ncbi:MAG: aminopeptidase [bacterium]|nr:aminopeptidase [bacterium]
MRISSLGWALLLWPLLSGCYVVEQGWGQLKLGWSSVPLEEAHEPDPQLAALLAQVPQIKAFGQSQLGLKATQNYQAYLPVPGEGVTYVVTAAPKLSLSPHQWWFPVIGSVPYKGYFDHSDAEDLKADLEAQGLDTYLFAAPAYSTLGWFEDPVTTPMLRQGLYDLAETLLHEMTHATLYVNDQGDFNEQLASFVGAQGAEAYLRGPAGWDEARWEVQVQGQERGRRAAELVRQWIPQFEELYASELKEKEKLEQRALLFAQLSQAFEAQTGVQRTFNNARLLQYRRYQKGNAHLEALFNQAQGHWPQFWTLLRQDLTEKGWDLK